MGMIGSYTCCFPSCCPGTAHMGVPNFPENARKNSNFVGGKRNLQLCSILLQEFAFECFNSHRKVGDQRLIVKSASMHLYRHIS